MANLFLFNIGGIIAAIPHSTSNFRAQDIIDDLETIKPKVVVLHPMFLDKVLPLLPSVGVPESHVLLVGEEDECKKVNAQGVRTIQKLFLSHRPDFADLEKLEKDACYRYTENDIIHAPSYLFFTSGSTGKRKAVMITQYAAVSVLVNRPVDPSNEAVKILACNKLFHVSSLILALHLCVYNGDKVYVINKFLLEDLCIAIEKYKINSMMALFYNISEMCSKSVADKYDLSSLIVVYNIGTKLHHSAIQKLKDRHNLSVIDTYGLTETLIMFQNNMEYTKKGGAGVLARGYEARLVDEDGDDVPRGEIGQLCIKGPTVCLGYYNDPAATASTFDSEGYIMTGDLLRCDKQGLFHYIDRYKDMIRYYESSIFPTSIESVLVKHPMILECAVVGIKVPAKNIEIPKAFIRLIETQILDETEQEQLKKEIIKYIGDRLPDEMRLRGGVSIVDSFPRTYSGKIRRFTLKVEANQMELISKK